MDNLFFRMPRLTLLAIGFILLMGLSSLSNLPRQEDPTMTERFGQVETFMPGASALRVEALVTEKVENALREVPEVKTIASITRAGYSHIQAELYDSVGKGEVDLVWSEVRDKLGEVRAELPTNASDPLLEARGPLAVTLGVAIKAGTTPISIQERIAAELKARLAALPGTKDTEIFGEPEQEIRVEVNPYQLARVNLSIDEFATAIAASDTRISAGQLHMPDNSLVVEVKGELSSTERIASIPLVQQANGTLVRVADVARVIRAYVDPPATLALVDGERAIVITTKMETGRRVDAWVAAAKAVVADYQSELPEQVQLKTLIDQNFYTSERLENLANNLLMAIVLVLVALLFLMGIRSAIIVGTALPLTMALVLTGLWLMDIPLHQMSVTGLIIALGLLIDNAIVVVEEYKLNRRRGGDFGAAISHSVQHLFVPLLASTATTAFAFMPIATTPGGVGDFTGTMAVSVVLSVTASFFLAMTVIPALAGFIDQKFPPGEKAADGWWVNGYSPRKLGALYRTSIRWVIESPRRGVAVSLVLPLLGFLLAGTMTSAFFPPVDRNQFQVQVSLPASASVTETLRLVRHVRELLAEYPEVTESQWFVGEGAPEVYYNMMITNDGVSSFASGFVTTRDVDDPRRILAPLQEQLMATFPEAQVMAMPFEQGPPFSAPVELRIVGPDLDVLKQLGEEMRLLLSRTDAVTYTTATLSRTVPQLSIYPDENQVARLGISNRDIPGQMNSKLSGVIVGAVMEGSTEVPVRVRLDDSVRRDMNEIAASPLMGRTGSTAYGGVPLEQVADVLLEPSPNRVDRYQGERINTVSGFLLPYAYPSEAVNDFRQRYAEQGITLPKGYRIEFGGEEEERGEAVGNMIATFAMYFWLMVAVIVLSLNSFRYAGVIGLVGLLSVGLALFGVWLSGYPLGYMALIGTLGLIGLAINGAIIVLSALKANEAALAGDVPVSTQIVMDASRHIVSTTVTTIGGFLPLILFGGHFWPPLAMAIAGGVTGSAILALYLVPAMFSFIVQRDVRRARLAPVSLFARLYAALAK
ncbi:MAG: efflux RND transporter permease subunit [Pseudomonadota bacterium]